MIHQSNPTRILIIDDDEDDFILLKDYLEEIPDFNFILEWISTFHDAEKAVKEGRHDLYFFDYLLGADTGLELLKRVIPFKVKAPIIFLTGRGDRKTDIDAMQLGAWDFLVKSGINSENLERSIRYSLERMQTLNALKESETRFRGIFERSRDMIYITDENGNFLTVNDSATRIFGYTKEEFVAMNARDLYYDFNDRENILESIRKSGVITNHEVALKDKSNNLRYCIISGSIQQTGDDNQIYYQGIIHDITRRKKIEKELLIAEKLAMTGRLVRTLAHEVRNPLTNINLSVEQLEFEIENNELQMYFGIIKRNSNRINDLISELLGSSRPAEINMQKVNFNLFIEQTLSLAIDRITLRNIEVIKEFDDQVSEINIDAPLLKIALLNIIINAVESVKDNVGQLRLKTGIRDDQCFISIMDNGSGISKENLGRLFEPYFTDKPNGTGLGLATAHNIIQSHNGTIEVESTPGKGSCFTISLGN